MADSAGGGQEAALFRAIKEQKKIDPLAGVKIGAKELVQRLIEASKNEKGVHIDSLLAAIASVAGFSCQMAIREAFVKTGKLTLRQALVEAELATGEKFYFGDLLNEPLTVGQYSIWSLAGGGAQSVGCTTLPDLHEIASHCAKTVGKDNFGHPRLPEGHGLSDLPVNYVRNVWPQIRPLLEKFCDTPIHWPILLGLAAQEVIIMGKDAIDPAIALTIVMECAFPSSKFDPVKLGIAF